MVGYGLKKLAKENGMQVDAGVAYGNFKGFAVTFSEGAGYKRMDVVTKFPDAEQKKQFEEALRGVDVSKTYRVQQLIMGSRYLRVEFYDNPGTMKKMEAFFQWFFPLLAEHGAVAGNVCPQCGGTAPGAWYLLDGVAYPMHDSCAAQMQESLNREETRRKEEDDGSYGTGLVGAFLGALLGSAVWAVVLYLGYVVAYIGLLVGWLAERGYALFRGKQGKGKLWILILAVIFGVIMGTLLPDAVSLGVMIANGELPGYSYGDIPGMIVMLLQADSEYSGAVLSNIGLGLVFAALGVFGLLARTKKELDAPVFRKLK